MTETKPICPGEMTANEAVKFFDNICDEQGKKLVKVAKRSKLRELMVQLFINKSKNKCKLASGKYVPIIVYRKNPHRGGACYFNNIDAP
ncbi:MAG: hypothetical protein J6W96_06680, partial [Alphaproteobacteria bacterium]|nr:hypothetical protein [Alphaproteobacteria bacterium]